MTEQGLYDIYGTWHIPFWQTKIFWAIIIALISFLCFCVVWYCVRRFFWKKHDETFYDKALRELHVLLLTKVINKEDGKLFYFKITAILKTYLDNRYGFTLAGKTDQEVILFLEKSCFPSELLSSARDIFTGCLRIKYADEQAVQDQVARDFHSAELIIKQTCPSDKEK